MPFARGARGEEFGKACEGPRAARCAWRCRCCARSRGSPGIGRRARRQVADLQRFDRLAGVRVDEVQEQNDGVAIAANRMDAHAALRGQVVLEEAHDARPRSIGVTRLHATLPPPVRRTRPRTAHWPPRRAPGSSAGSRRWTRSRHAPCTSRAWATAPGRRRLAIPAQQACDREAVAKVVNPRPPPVRSVHTGDVHQLVEPVAQAGTGVARSTAGCGGTAAGSPAARDPSGAAADTR